MGYVAKLAFFFFSLYIYESNNLVPLVQFSLYDGLESKINILTLTNTCVYTPPPHTAIHP